MALIWSSVHLNVSSVFTLLLALVWSPPPPDSLAAKCYVHQNRDGGPQTKNNELKMTRMWRKALRGFIAASFHFTRTRLIHC